VASWTVPTKANAQVLPVDDLDPWVADPARFGAHAGGNGDGDAAGVATPGEGALGTVFSDVPAAEPARFVAFESPPELVTMDRPLYTEIAREAGVEGTVVVLVLVGQDGFVDDARIADGVVMQRRFVSTPVSRAPAVQRCARSGTCGSPVGSRSSSLSITRASSPLSA